MTFLASVRLVNKCASRHSSRKRPLKLSMKQLSVGFPGRMNSNLTLCSCAQRSRALLNKQEFLRAKSTAEVISRLESLEKSIRSAVDSVRSAAHEVRAYPAEVVTQLSTRVEVCFARCEDAAKRAVEVFVETKSTHKKLERNYLMLLFTACMGVGAIMGAMFVFLPKLFS